MGDSHPDNPGGYDEFLRDLKRRVRDARVRAALSVNSELVQLYWRIGQDILDRQERTGWGAAVVDRLATDLRREFPEMRGFSARNLRSMKNFAQAWPDLAIVKQVVSQIPWGHNVRLLQKVKDSAARLWYARKTIENGWSRNVLCLHIDRQLFQAHGAAPTNFETTLPAPQSDLARETLKDLYKLDFLGVAGDAQERVIEGGLIRHIRDFLLELGQGFAFVGNQVPLEVGGESFRIDLLFYHLQLRCYVVIELKAGAFRPEHMGKLSFYLSAVDDLLRHAADRPSIGLVLCRNRNDIVAEYALRGANQPLAVSKFELTRSLPRELEGKLPSIDDIEARLEDATEDD